MRRIWANWRAHEFSAVLVIVVTVLFIAIMDNLHVWTALFADLDLGELSHLGFAATVLLAIMAVLFLLLLPALTHGILKALLIFLLLLTALIGYFNTLGIAFDELMLRSIMSSITDKNVSEALELVSPPLLVHMVLLGLLPSCLVYMTRLKPAGVLVSLLQRCALVVGSLALALAIVAINYKHTIHLIGEHKALERGVNPLYPITGLVKTVRSTINEHTVFEVLGEDATRVRAYPGKTVGILVVGETARGDRFALNGYERATNPRLAERSLLSFSDAQACGTTTFFTIPCIFSFLPENAFTPYKAEHQSNVLDVLDGAGVHVLWRDNNPNCKGVCDRVANENLARDHDPSSPYYNNGEYLDEVMLANLEQYIDAQQGDVLIVLHQMGSHGPAYFRRFPAAMATFTPYCQEKAQQQCDLAGLNNSYDNTIVYTDYFLDKAIALIERNNDKYASFLFYLSDHGESLGENGVYLHGAPHVLAIKEQFHIPMMLWFSDSYLAGYELDEAALSGCRDHRVSQYQVAHTLMSLFGYDAEVYNAELDLLRLPCASGADHHGP